MTTRVVVCEGGKPIETIDRVAILANGHNCIPYRGRIWRLHDGAINLDQPSIALQTRRADAAADDDEDDRLAVRDAGAAARLLVDAGPGTGKTQLAAYRISDLIRRGLSPGQLLVLSLSRSAVRTLTRRLTKIETDERSVEELRHLAIRTFDAWAFRMLRLLGEQPSALLRRSHDDNIVALTKAIMGPSRDAVRERIGDRRHLIIDEFQDLPGVRGDLVIALLGLLAPRGKPGAGFTILGDPAQAIYGFAARASGHDTSPKEYWDRVRETYGEGLERRMLRKNFRADAPLAQLASELRTVLLGEGTAAEKLEIMKEKVGALPPDGNLDPAWLASGEGSRAILTRTNAEALRVLQKLAGTGHDGPPGTLHIRTAGHANLPPPWIGAILRPFTGSVIAQSRFNLIHQHLCKLWDENVRRRIAMPDEATAWRRLCIAAGVGDDATSLEIAALRSRMSWPDAFPEDELGATDGVVVTTIHQSKGMEFDSVTVLESRSREVREGEQAPPPPSPAEEAEAGSVLYVAVTRAARSLTRLPADSIHIAPFDSAFDSGRKRLLWWRNGWVNLETGIPGDVDPASFVDPAIHGGPEQVAALQETLLKDLETLEGRKVLLVKTVVEGKAFYDIHVQEKTNQPGLRLGRMGQQLTTDLLQLLWSKGYSLPGWIMNLRIASIGTMTSDAERQLNDPERTSRLWLGISLFGTGDFKPKKRV